jgi:hypothetical protein
MVVFAKSETGLIISLPGFGLSNKVYFFGLKFMLPLSGLFFELILKILISLNSFCLKPELANVELRIFGEGIKVLFLKSGLFLIIGLPGS